MLQVTSPPYRSLLRQEPYCVAQANLELQISCLNLPNDVIGGMPTKP